LTSNNASDAYPLWSPDGRKIAFSSNREGKSEIYVMDADGSNVTRLTKLGTSQPAWSSDGTKIAFIRPGIERMNGYSPPQVFAVDADGSNVRMLTSSPNPAGEPCWSPEGAKVAFIMFVDRIGTRTNIFQVDSDGGNLKRLTAGPAHDRRPSLSPDGSKLAFQSNRDGNYDIFVLNLR
jgi:TolB protein